MPPQPGGTLSHYRLVETIGQGGMGVVYKALDTDLARHVAIKILPSDVTADPDRRLRFQREARAAAALNHPNIATIHEIGEDDGTQFIVMELVEGRTLRDLVRQGPLPFAEWFELVLQIAEGLAHAHDHGIVHRDLKPENVMITTERQVKILDFGLARPEPAATPGRLDPGAPETVSAELTREGSVAGTFAYMSPEHAVGKGVDARSDIFSLGILMYEMAAGRRPFAGETWGATLVRILRDDPEPLRGARPDLPASLERIIDRCLRKRPEERYERTRDVLRELKSLPASMPSVGAGEARRVRLRPWLTAALGTAALLLLIYTVLALYRGYSSRRGGIAAGGAVTAMPRAVAVLPFSVHGGGEFAYLGEGMVNLLSTLLDGAGSLRSVDARAVLGAVERERVRSPDPDRGRAIARHLGAGRFVLGDIVEAGGRLRINATLYEAHDGAPPVAQATAEGGAQQIFEMVDSVAAQLLAGQPGGPAARVTRLAAVTTHSIPALKAYLDGEGEFRAGRFAAAVEAFERAVAADDSFALAYYRLSIAAEWGSRDDLARDAAERAVRHGDRLSQHDRLLLGAILAWRRGAGAEAERLYRTILDAYPDDVEAWFQLGEILFHDGPLRGRSIAESREPFEKVLFYESDHVPSLLHQARIAAIRKDLAELGSLVDRIQELNPDGERVVEVQALRAFALADPAAETRAIDRLRQARDIPLLLTAAFLPMYAGNLEGAQRVMRLMTGPERSPEMRALGHLYLAQVEVGRGRFGAAAAELGRARPLSPAAATEYGALLHLAPFLPVPRARLQAVRDGISRWDPSTVPPSVNRSTWSNVHDGLHPLLRAYLLALLDARLGSDAEALRAASRLERIEVPSHSSRLPADLARSVRAEVARRRGRPAEALGLLEQAFLETPYLRGVASPFVSGAYDRYARAELLDAQGRSEEALLLFGSFAEFSVYDLVYLAPSHFRRGAICEKLGRPREAADHYAQFARLWKDCDPELRPLVDQANVRLAHLRSGQGGG